MATQWHKSILSDFSLELEDRSASSYQACNLKVICQEVDWLFPMKDSHDREEKKREIKEKKKLIGLLQFPWEDFLKG